MSNTFTDLSNSLLNMSGQDNYRGGAGGSNKIIYSAIVRDVNDNAGLSRIKAEIVSLDSNGKVVPGKDKDTPLEKLPICIPLISSIINMKPSVGEMVLIICENPSDLSSVRYWVGPIITQQTKLPYQSYEDATEIYKQNTYAGNSIGTNPSIKNNTKAALTFPQPNEIAIQGRKDAFITFSPREVNIKAGVFKKDSTEINISTPCKIQIKQVDDSINPTGVKVFDNLHPEKKNAYSQQNWVATNINIYSPEGKFKKVNLNDEEFTNNPRLKDFDATAQSLHPVPFGDELIILLRLLIRHALQHIHTPQKPSLSNALTEELEKYLGPKMQDLVSNFVRIN